MFRGACLAVPNFRHGFRAIELPRVLSRERVDFPRRLAGVPAAAVLGAVPALADDQELKDVSGNRERMTRAISPFPTAGMLRSPIPQRWPSRNSWRGAARAETVLRGACALTRSVLTSEIRDLQDIANQGSRIVAGWFQLQAASAFGCSLLMYLFFFGAEGQCK